VQNAKQELVSSLGSNTNKVICAVVKHSVWDAEESYKSFKLLLNHTQEDFTLFLDSLDFDYDNGYGLQELYGTVWFNDGTWLQRWEHDGSEGWEYITCPEVPTELYPNL
jgi:hypothetical protein